MLRLGTVQRCRSAANLLPRAVEIKAGAYPKTLPVGMARAQLPHADSTGSLGDGLRNSVFRDDRLLLEGGQAGSTQPNGKNSEISHSTYRPSHSNDDRLRFGLHYS